LRKEDAVSLLEDIPFDLLLIDMGMAMVNDYSIVKKIKRSFPGVVVVVAAYLHQKGAIAGAVSAGANGEVTKPIKVDSFRRKIAEFFCNQAP
jgi:DNA-binding NarL/FixJ family response regulator